jgi:hypothetical protein
LIQSLCWQQQSSVTWIHAEAQKQVHLLMRSLLVVATATAIAAAGEVLVR